MSKHAKAVTAPVPAFDPQPWKDAVGRFRTTSKWVVAAFGSIGALIVAAVPLAAISNTAPEDRGVVMWGAVLALTGVSLAIVAAAANLIPRNVYAHEIVAKTARVRKKKVAHVLAEHPASVLPAGVPSLAAMQAQLQQLPLTIGQAPKGPLRDSLEERLATLQASMDGLLWYRRFEKARAVYWAALCCVVVGAVATGAGMGLLLYGLDDPKAEADAKKTEAEALQIQANVAKLRVETADLRAHPVSDRQAAEIAKIEAETAKLDADVDQVRYELDHPPAEPSDDSVEATLDNLRAQTEKLRAETAEIQARIAAATPGG